MNWPALDVVISGGGLVGWACSVALAKVGKSVLIVERRGSLGWEVSRARRCFARLESASTHSSLVASLVNTLHRHEGYHRGVIDPAIAELALERMAVECGVTVLFHGWVSRLDRSVGGANGIVIGTKEGYRKASAPWIIETDDDARLVEQSQRMIRPSPAMVRSALFLDVTQDDEIRAYSVPDVGEVTSRRVGDGRTLLDIPLPDLSSYSARVTHFFKSLRLVGDHLKTTAADYSSAKLAGIADDEWSLPSFSLSRRLVTGGGTSVGALFTGNGDGPSTVQIVSGDLGLGFSNQASGIIMSGPWLPKYLSCSNNEELALVNRFLIGEAAAEFVLREGAIRLSSS